MKLDEAKTLLDQARYYDGRTITDTDVDAWQRALIRHPFEAAFDAVHTHFEQCGPRTPLVAGHVLEHITTARRAAELEEHKQRERDRNDSLFGTLTDRRDEGEKQRALAAMRTGRAELNQILAGRRGEPVEAPRKDHDE